MLIIERQARHFMKSQNRLAKQLFFVLIVGVICTWIVYQIDQYQNVTISGKMLNLDNILHQGRSESGFLVNTKGCRIHDLDPFDPSIKSYFYNENLNCDKNKSKPLVKFTTKDLYVDKDNINLYLNISLDVLKCCYTPFWRIEVKPGVNPRRYDNTFEFSENCFSFFEKTEISYEFVKVTCTSGNRTIYKDYLTFVHKKKSKKKNPNDRSQVSVLTLGLDAVSRLNSHRQLPKTLNLLKNLGAVEMLGYNKVGDNTFPNLVPVLTGLNTSELQKKCWFNDSLGFDQCNFIWDYFNKKGYQTGYAEDSTNIGTFNYANLKGFRKQPTDFYYRVFSKLSEHDIGSEHWSNTYICSGNRLTIQYLLNSAKSFVINLKDILSFGFFWSNSISHDYLNLPKHSDQIYYDFLIDIKNNGILDRTVVFFMSDHGIRWGSFRGTYHGYVEERLPFLYILLPKWFNEQYPNAVTNIKRNMRRLTTPFDLHETYKHLLNISTLSQKYLKIGSKNKERRGTSLFLPIGKERTCEDAGIPYNWCTCHQSTPENVNNTIVIQAAKHFIIYLNDLLSGYRQCSKLTLESIIKSRSEKMANNDTRTKHLALNDFTLTIKTNPGSALFQATVRHDKSKNEFNVLEPVSRINTYGNQSNCVSNYKLKLYCYCLGLW